MTETSLPDAVPKDSLDRGVPPPTSLVLPWRTLALIAVGTAVAGISGTTVALVLVATAKEEAGALETIALSLAILAFVIQIVVFIAQTFAASQQLSRAEEIYASMRGLLEGLRGTAEGTHETLQRHMDVLLKAATGAASEAVAEGVGEKASFDPDEFERRVLDRVRAAQVVDQQQQRSQARPPARTPTDDDLVIAEQMRTYPSEAEGRTAADALRGLSVTTLSTLHRLANDELVSRESGNTVGFGLDPTDPATQELVERGLVELQDIGLSGDRHFARLTPKGRDVGRLLTAQGEPPEWMPTIV